MKAYWLSIKVYIKWFYRDMGGIHLKERQEEMFSIIANQPKVTVKELSELLGVSAVTIRKELSELEREGVLKRTHGGIAQMSSDSIEKRMLYRYNHSTVLHDATSLFLSLQRAYQACKYRHT